MSDKLPVRPRLAPNVWARRHWVGSEERIILRGPGFDGILNLGDAAWEALTFADGTRDLEGLRAACAREGVHWTRGELEELLGELHAVGFLVDGAARYEEPSGETESDDALRPLEQLAGFAFRCDGRGSCCRFYDTIAVRPEEGQLARLLTLRDRAEEIFTPCLGAQLDRSSWAPMMVEGRCAFLDGEGCCAIHRAAGYAQKPLGCRVYPRSFTDDGVAVRVSVSPECACVFASVGCEDGEPLVPSSVTSVADLGEEAIVSELPERVALSESTEVDRAELRLFSQWLDGWVRQTDEDLAAVLWHLADIVETRGLTRSLDAVPALPDEAQRWLSWLGRAASNAARDDGAWRSPLDMQLRVVCWLAAALRSPGNPPRSPRDERWYLLTLNHAHRLAAEPRTLASGLRDRAVRILAARAMLATPPGFDDPSTAHPLAMLEALLRDTKLSRYAPLG